MTERRYLPTFADLVDRLSIVLLKTIFDPDNRAAHLRERDLIEHDLGLMLGKPRLIEAIDIRAFLVLMLSNRYVWENESDVRSAPDSEAFESEVDWVKFRLSREQRLMLTHSINGVRNTAKNVLARRMGDRLDLKVDCLSVDVTKNYGNWNLFEDAPHGPEK